MICRSRALRPGGRWLAVAVLGAVLLVLPGLAWPGAAIFKHVNRTFVKPGEVRLLTDEDYYPALLTAIEGARTSIEVVMYLFKTTSSPRNKPKHLVAALVAARKRGVAVRVVLEQSNYDDTLNQYNRAVAKKLTRQGIAVYFDSPKTTTHTKIVMVDDHLCFVGSHNLTHSALTYNHEASILINNPAFANQLKNYLQGVAVTKVRAGAGR